MFLQNNSHILMKVFFSDEVVRMVKCNGLGSCRLLAAQTGLSKDKPYLDPCLPPDLSDMVVRGNDTLHLRGWGDWAQCLELVRPFLGLHNGTMSPGGIYQVELTSYIINSGYQDCWQS